MIKIKSPLHVFTQKTEKSLGSSQIAVKTVLFLLSQGFPTMHLGLHSGQRQSG